MTGDLRERFWERFGLNDLNDAEWEAVCDGCGRCCVLKFQDEDDSELYYTSVTCRNFDSESCRCKNYERRTELVPNCIKLTPESVDENLDWMPKTCAYRLLREGKPLYEWHPLVSGDPRSVSEAGKSISGNHVSEEFVHEDDLRNFIVKDR